MAWLFTSPPVGATVVCGAPAGRPPCWKMPRPRSWIHFAMSSDITPATKFEFDRDLVLSNGVFVAAVE